MAKRSYKFTDKKHTKQGMISSALGLAALILMGLGIFLAYRMSGNAGSYTGLLGLLSMLASAAGFVLALRGFQEEDVYYLFSQVGVVLNGALFILWVLIFIMGM